MIEHGSLEIIHEDGHVDAFPLGSEVSDSQISLAIGCTLSAVRQALNLAGIETKRVPSPKNPNGSNVFFVARYFPQVVAKLAEIEANGPGGHGIPSHPWAQQLTQGADGRVTTGKTNKGNQFRWQKPQSTPRG